MFEVFTVNVLVPLPMLVEPEPDADIFTEPAAPMFTVPPPVPRLSVAVVVEAMLMAPPACACKLIAVPLPPCRFTVVPVTALPMLSVLDVDVLPTFVPR